MTTAQASFAHVGKVTRLAGDLLGAILVTLILSACTLTFLPARAKADTVYAIVPVANISVGSRSISNINENGELALSPGGIIGSADPLLYNGATFQDLGSYSSNIPSFLPTVASLNAQGEVVGNLAFNVPQVGISTHAIIFSGSGTDLTNLSNLFLTYANSINNNGQVVGYGEQAPGSPLHAIFYDGSSVIDLNPLLGNPLSSVATGINDNGVVTGYYTTFNGVCFCEHPFTYDGSLHDLFTPITQFGSDSVSRGLAAAINANGEVAGAAFINENFQATIWSNGQMIDIGSSSGAATSFASALNDNGQVVGQITPAFGPPSYLQRYPFLYSGGIIHNINDLIWANDPLKGQMNFSYVAPTGINNKGQISIVGAIPAYAGYAIILNPIDSMLFSQDQKAEFGQRAQEASALGNGLLFFGLIKDALAGTANVAIKDLLGYYFDSASVVAGNPYVEQAIGRQIANTGEFTFDLGGIAVACSAFMATLEAPGVDLATSSACGLAATALGVDILRVVYRTLQQDPPEPNYTRLFVPTTHPSPLPLTGSCSDLNAAIQRSLYALDDALALLDALYVTSNRYSTAIAYNDVASAALQNSAFQSDLVLYDTAAHTASVDLQCEANLFNADGAGAQLPTGGSELAALSFLQSAPSASIFLDQLFGEAGISDTDIASAIQDTLANPPILPTEGPGTPLGQFAAGLNSPLATSAVPEPLTLSLFGAGLVGAAAIRRRKKK